MPASDKHLPLYRILGLLGGVLIIAHGVINRLAVPDFVEHFWVRLAVGLLCLGFVGLTYTSSWVRRHAGPLLQAICAVITLWYLWVAYQNALSLHTVLGLIMVLFGCSLVFQTVRSLGLYLGLTILGVIGLVALVEEPEVHPTFYLRTIVAIAVLDFFVLRSRLKLQEEVMRSASLMRSLFEAAADALILYDPDRRQVVDFNPRAHALFETTSAEELLARLLPTLTEVQEEAERADAFETEARFLTRTGRAFWGSLALRSLNWEGRPLWLIRIADISQRKEDERLRDEFISVTSHELRTPLTSIAGSLSLLSGGVAGPLPEQARKMIGIAQRNCERLIRLINDLLDIQKIAAGKFELRPTPQPVMPMIRQGLEACRGFEARYDVRLELRGDLPDTLVRADGDRIQQVLMNLLSNAAKYSPPGGTIVIDVSRQGDAVRIAVTDQGPGIPADQQTKLFEKFVQVTPAEGPVKEGTGLGLSICKSIVEMHGGTIGCHSVPGEGSTFYFILPVWHPEAPPSPLEAHRQSRTDRPVSSEVKQASITR